MTYFGKQALSSSYVWDNTKVTSSIIGNKYKNYIPIAFYETVNQSAATYDHGSGIVSISPIELSASKITLRTVLNTNNQVYSASVKLYNYGTAGFVDIGGVGITRLTTSNTTPTVLESENLIGASGFTLTTSSLYELRVYIENTGALAVLSNADFVVDPQTVVQNV